MKNNKTMAVISWIISVGYILTAVLIGVGEEIIPKTAKLNMGLAVVWIIIGIIYWKKNGKKER